MKKIIYMLSLLCSFLGACNDDSFLREKPEDFLTVDNAFLNINQFRTGVNQMYSQVRALYNNNDSRNDWVLMGIGLDVFTAPTPDTEVSQPEFNDWKKVNSSNSKCMVALGL